MSALPNYLPELLSADLKPGTITVVTVRHDAWCAHWTDGVCNCKPEIVSEPMGAA